MSNTTENQHEISKTRVTAVLGGLSIFGLAYNWMVSRIEDKGYDEGYTSDLVVAGTLITVLATWPILGLRGVAVVLAAFVASGGPMSIGSKARYRARRARELHAQQRYGAGNDGNTNHSTGSTSSTRPITAAWLQTAAKSGRYGRGRASGLTVPTRLH